MSGTINITKGTKPINITVGSNTINITSGATVRTPTYFESDTLVPCNGEGGTTGFRYNSSNGRWEVLKEGVVKFYV